MPGAFLHTENSLATGPKTSESVQGHRDSSSRNARRAAGYQSWPSTRNDRLAWGHFTQWVPHAWPRSRPALNEHNQPHEGKNRFMTAVRCMPSNSCVTPSPSPKGINRTCVRLCCFAHLKRTSYNRSVIRNTIFGIMQRIGAVSNQSFAERTTMCASSFWRGGGMAAKV